MENGLNRQTVIRKANDYLMLRERLRAYQVAFYRLSEAEQAQIRQAMETAQNTLPNLGPQSALELIACLGMFQINRPGTGWKR